MPPVIHTMGIARPDASILPNLSQAEDSDGPFTNTFNEHSVKKQISGKLNYEQPRHPQTVLNRGMHSSHDIALKQGAVLLPRPQALPGPLLLLLQALHGCWIALLLVLGNHSVNGVAVRLLVILAEQLSQRACSQPECLRIEVWQVPRPGPNIKYFLVLLVNLFCKV